MKRTANIVIRVSPVEKKKLEALAKKEGLAFSAWVRRFAYVQSSNSSTAPHSHAAQLAKIREKARSVAQWSDACWTGGYAGNQPHPALGDVQELRDALEGK